MYEIRRVKKNNNNDDKDLEMSKKEMWDIVNKFIVCVIVKLEREEKRCKEVIFE